jgi:hypothetical protein
MSKRKEARTFQRPHQEGKVREVPYTRFSSVDCCGEGPFTGARLTGVNRRDTSIQVTTGGPVILNKGEHIFTTYPRRVDMGKTIRCQDDQIS